MRDGVVIGVASVEAGEDSEAVGALGGEVSEGGDAGEGYTALLSLAYLFSEAFCREDTLLHKNLRLEWMSI